MLDMISGKVIGSALDQLWTKVKRIFSGGKMTEPVKEGEVVIDVRTREEYANGHFEKSINIPLDEIESVSLKYDKKTSIIVCCASGARSERAKQKLQSMDFQSVKNAGSWRSLC